jgi:thiol:disulfide interchange protein
MVCNDGQCLPPTTVNFSFNVEGSAKCIGVVTPATNTTSAKEKLCECDSDAIFKTISLRNNKTVTTPAKTDTSKVSVIAEDPHSTNTNGEHETTKSRSWWGIFLAGFLGGLAALLTPCVFPMIPMTVSFFTKSSKTRAKGISNALIYGSSIIIIYVLLGLGVTKIFGPSALNALSTNIWFNLAFFVLLVVFAISFLGAFEIVLPSRFINKMDSQSDKGGLIGIFFMAFTLSLVSFSCTGPIIGTLLVEAAVNGGLQGPFWGMFGFSAALALPFGLFAAFPGWLNTLPKSGGWLNSVKVVLGFLELALAFKFASNADLVVQAGILTREIFIAIWITIFGLLGIYLMGWIKLSHDSVMQHLSVPRLFFAILTFAFTIYLIPGLWGAPLKLISGFPPPDFYSESPQGFGNSKNSQTTTSSQNTSENGHTKEHCPNGLPCFHNYDEALAYAKKVGKPLMLDFTGWACVNCRKMESQVWTDPEVDKRLRNEVVLVSLYVDDKTELPANEQTVKKLGNRDFAINSIGNKWSYMQANIYKTNTQPQYILIDTNEQMLTPETAHYDPDINKYVNWLDEGITKFKKEVSK